MKKIFVVSSTLLLILSTNSFSKTTTHRVNEDNQIESEHICNSVALASKKIMSFRQNTNGDLAEFIDEINSRDERPKLKKLMKTITYEAFDRPQWSTEESKNKEVVDFSNKMYMDCVKGLTSK